MTELENLSESKKVFAKYNTIVNTQFEHLVQILFISIDKKEVEELIYIYNRIQVNPINYIELHKKRYIFSTREEMEKILEDLLTRLPFQIIKDYKEVTGNEFFRT